MKKIEKLALTQKLKEKRKKIDLLDRRLLTLVNQRLRIALEAGRMKREMGKKIHDPKREEEILEKLRLGNKGPLREEDLKKIFKTVMGVCRKSEEREDTTFKKR